MLARNVAAIVAAQGEAPPLDDRHASHVRVEEASDALVLSWKRDDRWIALNSRRDPVAEAHRWLDNARVTSDAATLVLIGAGLGYVLDALEQRAPLCRVGVLEPRPELARALLERRDWTAWIESGRLRLLVGPDYVGAAGAWRTFADDGGSPPVVVHPVLAREMAEEVAAASRVARRLLFDARANADARRQNAGRYLLNSLRNLPAVAAAADVMALSDRFSSCPAVIVSAGPSLDHTIPALKALRDRAIVVAVDTALRPLLTAGISPHFAVALDPTKANAEHLTGLPDASDVWLIAEGSLDPSAFAPFHGRTFVFRVADHHPWPWLRSRGCERGLLNVHGSVATAALDFARRLGCDPVVFCGQDLAFTGRRSYCSGTTRDLWPSSHDGWSAIAAADVHGRPTTTAPHLVAFRDWIVEQSVRDVTRRYVNASDHGILYGGRIETMSLASALAECPPLDDGAIRAAIGSAGVADSALAPAIVQDARALASVIGLEEAPPEPLSTWLSFAGPAVRVDDIRRALADGAGSAERDRLREQLLQDVARATEQQIHLAAGHPLTTSGRGAVAPYDRIHTVYRHLARARGWLNGSVLPRRDVLRLMKLVTDAAPQRVLALDPGNGLTSLLVSAYAPSGTTIHAVRTGAELAAGEQPQAIVAEAARLAQVLDRVCWLDESSLTATGSDRLRQGYGGPPELHAKAEETQSQFDLILLDTNTRRHDTDTVFERAVRLLRRGGVLAVTDSSDRVVGTHARRAILELLARDPAVSLVPLRTTDRFSRLTLLRRDSREPAEGDAPSPLVNEHEAAAVADVIAQRFAPSSVVVFGRAAAAWAEPIRAIKDVSVRTINLETLVSDGYAVDPPSRCDLAVCVDTLEFVPTEQESRVLQAVIESSDTILFAAPVPGFHGDRCPNLRPVSYWVERFLEHGYAFADTIRPAFEDRSDFSARQCDLTLYCVRKIAAASDREAVVSSAGLRALLAGYASRIDDLFLQAAMLRLTLRDSRALEDDDPRLLPSCTDILALAASEIEHVTGHRYVARFSDTRTRLCQQLGLLRHGTLEEDGRPLIGQQTLIDDIGTFGHGRYYVAPDAAHFSSSDNSDPRTNGRRYALRVPAMVARLTRC